ncbi:GDP-mannose 4,6-dehydratase [Candidatus Bipolaricaulota bacterium]|nr:GDP-mannose 4,6-dehydratase [Candidatus Bipolaricaulota bacterium]
MTTQPVALITGITGQDGSYLAEFLLNKGYAVHGIARRTSMFSRDRIEGLRTRVKEEKAAFELHYADLGDSSSLNSVIAALRPSEIYNLAAQSHVGISFQQPEYTADVTGTGVLRILEAVRSNKLAARIYQASTSELFGQVTEVPQRETTPFHPRSPYAVAKLYAYWIVKNYRESYGMHASNGILFNHESPRRGENFVTRKITMSLARIKAGRQETLRLGNLDAKRDWGYAKEYVEMMWLILQQPEPDDYVAGSGEAHTVREFVQRAAEISGFEIAWEGEGVSETGRDCRTGKVLVEVDPRYYRPAEVDVLIGDSMKARERLGWRPRTTFEQLVELMMRADLELLG